MSRSLKFERVFAHPPEKVWRALTEPELLGQWLMENDFEPVVGHEFQFRTDPAPNFDGIVHCRVLAVEEGKRLQYSWKGGPIDTVVTYELEAVPEGTRMRMEQSGFQGFRGWMIRSFLGMGFRTMLRERLPQVLRDMDGGDRVGSDGRGGDNGAGGHGSQADETPQDPGCMTWRQRVLAWILNVFPHRSSKP